MSRGEDCYGFEVFCKDFRSVKFASRQENHSRRKLYECLQMYSFPVSNKLTLFAFESSERFSFDGWSIYEPEKEYARMGIPNDTWRLTKINSHYDFADTYPAILCVPASADDEDLKKVASFRSKNRIPVRLVFLVYCRALYVRTFILNMKLV
ncbi:unnamed protein product [Soboliphyme baturini]|uniref:Myotubularin phosphatase domain-containing protein n=1 Tax=Soboliphyme baturini TaxID=241478 RepID=A0A183J863_9BILA|nr:unnamed protein product [Soboliphyme baturini]